jgi:hypothetical protein
MAAPAKLGIAALVALCAAVMAATVVFMKSEADQRGECTTDAGGLEARRNELVDLQQALAGTTAGRFDIKLIERGDYDAVLDDFDRGYCLIGDLRSETSLDSPRHYLTAWFYDSDRDARNGLESLDPVGRAQRKGEADGRDAQELPLANEVASGLEGVSLYCMSGDSERCTNWLTATVLEGCDAVVTPQVVARQPVPPQLARQWVSESISAMTEISADCKAPPPA